jgi:amino acid transporter
MDKLLNYSYYFGIRPDSNFQFTKLTLALVVVLFLISIGIWYYRKKYVKDPVTKKIIKRYPEKIFTFGLILLCLLVSREAGIPILSMRVLSILFFLYVAYWVLKTLITFRKEYKERAKHLNMSDKKDKYLPKKKKK